MKKKLALNELRNTCDTGTVVIESADLTQISNPIIGQPRASKALKLGVGIKSDGFNIYASGMAGSGRLTAVKIFVQEPAKSEATPGDWCYVNNFRDPYQPTKLSLPTGRGIAFKKEMKDLIVDVWQSLFKAFESEEYANRRLKVISAFEEQQSQAINVLSERAKEESLLLKQTPWEIITIPMIDGEPLTDEQFGALPQWQQDDLRKKQDKFLDEIKVKLSELRKQEKAVNRELSKLEKDVAIITISSRIEDVAGNYKQVPLVLEYLMDVKNDILDNLAEFLLAHKSQGGNNGQRASNFLNRYEVNVLVDNSELNGAPVIIEQNPTYSNLMGRVEKESYMGTMLTDFTMIRKGSLHAANGGYLIIRVEELLRNYFSWNALKRALKTKEIVIEEAGEQYGFFTTKTLKPEAIPLHVKVILIGHPTYYHLLFSYEPEFKGLFKVKADFDTEMDRTPKGESEYSRFVQYTCKNENLLKPGADAVARVVEYGSRLVSDQHKLSTRFGDIADIVREAHHYALGDKSDHITESHILKAIEEELYRSNLIQEKINEMITTGQLFIDLKGEKTGQINGLSVIDLGDIAFGRPNRITCSVNLGKEGVVAIEREAELSGPIHTKGVMILSGYLSEKYFQNSPASIVARIVFEQSYSEVEGDSASSAELYTILSSLSKLPIKQGIAVTGSVNQKGEVQAIGGVNEKIEGYFEVCRSVGLTGEQGVIIPASNVRNLMLKDEVLKAVSQQQFNIWAVDTIDDGIEILTGVKSGSPVQEGTVAYFVKQALDEYADRMKEFSNQENNAEIV
ncbi:Lon protease family protein [Flavihumibacter stibioxidans]|uniref:endopeptidase La n=1 Tax=Flavihumibacter stibioxidans TaxID=1834163 RepID=A0ABR7M5I8_9BACT|nr:ATP-binding protein [Flavihumibacter stibioxidans]MBC6490109.1 hypothetical protein [Flavihumibacter stibioxidans]